MRYGPIEKTDKEGRKIIIRNAEVSDGQALIDYMEQTSVESRFLIREPGERVPTLEAEGEFIKSRIEAERELMLVAYCGDCLVGACSLMSMGPQLRFAHRCGIAIALFKDYWGHGIGKLMLETLLEAAKEAGYEQAELEVVSGNDRAKALYENLGFVKYGELPDNMKYSDGTYASTEWMMKKLVPCFNL